MVEILYVGAVALYFLLAYPFVVRAINWAVWRLEGLPVPGGSSTRRTWWPTGATIRTTRTRHTTRKKHDSDPECIPMTRFGSRHEHEPAVAHDEPAKTLRSTSTPETGTSAHAAMRREVLRRAMSKMGKAVAVSDDVGDDANADVDADQPLLDEFFDFETDADLTDADLTDAQARPGFWKHVLGVVPVLPIGTHADALTRGQCVRIMAGQCLFHALFLFLPFVPQHAGHPWTYQTVHAYNLHDQV